MADSGFEHVSAGFVDEAGWLPGVDGLVKDAMKKGVVDVELVHRPATGRGKREHNANGCRLSRPGSMSHHNRHRHVE